MIKAYSVKLMFILLLTSCSTIEMQINRIPKSINIIQKIQTDYKPKKCIYSSINRTVFVLEEETGIIHIYRDGKQVNTIGGLGYTTSNFNKLEDITLSPDDNLLALDSFQKKIKKFDINGKLITEFNLNGFIEPTLFAVAVDETYYIYDNAAKEIIITRAFDDSDWFTFGKFQLSRPTKITLERNQILVYDKLENSTIIFGLLGQFFNETNGNIQIDKQQQYILSDYYFIHSKSKNKFAISINQWNDFSINGNVILISDNEIWIGKLNYMETNEN